MTHQFMYPKVTPGPAGRGRAGNRCPGRREDRGAGPVGRRPPRGVVALAARRRARGVRAACRPRRARSIVLRDGLAGRPDHRLLDRHRPGDRRAPGRRGHTVYATARRPESIADLEARGCRTLALDVTDEASMAAAVEQVVRRARRRRRAGQQRRLLPVRRAGDAPDSTTCAGSSRPTCSACVRMCQLVLPAMRARGCGRIVNVSSMGANFTFPGGGAYHATKYAVEAISDALRFEVAGFGIDVVIVQPGLIRTEFGETAVGEVDPASTPARAVRRVQRARWRRSPRGLRGGPAGAARRRPGDRRADDRAGDHGASRRRSATA